MLSCMYRPLIICLDQLARLGLRAVYRRPFVQDFGCSGPANRGGYQTVYQIARRDYT